MQDLCGGIGHCRPVLRKGIHPQPPLLPPGLIEHLQAGRELCKPGGGIPVLYLYLKRHLPRRGRDIHQHIVFTATGRFGNLPCHIAGPIQGPAGLECSRVHLVLPGIHGPFVKPSFVQPAGNLPGKGALRSPKVKHTLPIVKGADTFKASGRIGRHMTEQGQLEHAFTDTADMMVVYCRAHQGPGNEQGFCGIDTIFIKYDTVRCQVQVHNETVGIHRAVRCTGIVRIAEQVIHPVYIEIPVDDPRKPVAAPDHISDLARADPERFKERAELHFHDPGNIIVGASEPCLHERFACMGEGAVSHIMEEGGGHHQPALVVCKIEFPAGNSGQVHGAYRMLKARVGGAGIHKVRKAELPDIAQALDAGGVEEREDILVHLHIAMNRVLDDLGTHSKESSYTSHKSILVMITFLSGGTGTPKLLRGMQKVTDRHEISVVVNTAEDIWISGNHISPDVDTVMYLFAGVLNTDTWWGIRNDTFVTHEEILHLGLGEYIAIGDRDRAVHIARGNMLREGMRLTNATRTLCERFGVRENVLPMSDTEVTTRVKTELGLIHYQEYWIRSRGQIRIEDVVRCSKVPPESSEEVIQAVEASDVVVIGPSNPITSITPILECKGIREAMEDKYVIAVSPFIGNVPVSGPAAALMQASGFEPTSAGTAACYKDLVDLFIHDIRDPVEMREAIRLDTLMTGEEKSIGLAEQILALAKRAKA